MPTKITRATRANRPMARRKTLKTFAWPLAIVSIVASAYPPSGHLRNITNRGYGGGGRYTRKCRNRHSPRYLSANKPPGPTSMIGRKHINPYLSIATLSLVLTGAPSLAATNVAPTPPMGWNSWDSYGLTV